MMRIQRQESVSVRMPPSSAPAAPPAPPIAAHSPSARLRSGPSVNAMVRIESIAGATIAPPSPCTARARTSIVALCASPPTSEARPKTPGPTMNTVRRPIRSAARPPSSRKPANVSV